VTIPWKQGCFFTNLLVTPRKEFVVNVTREENINQITAEIILGEQSKITF